MSNNFEKYQTELEKLEADFKEKGAQRAREFAEKMQSMKQKHQEEIANLNYLQSLEIIKNELEY